MENVIGVAEDIGELLQRLAKANQREIRADSLEMGYVSMGLALLAQKVAEGDKTSDLSGYAALPGLLNKLFGNPKWDDRLRDWPQRDGAPAVA